MRTRSVNTEVLFNLSSSSNISDSLQRLGVGDGDTEMLVVGVDSDLEEVRGVVAGDTLGLTVAERTVRCSGDLGDGVCFSCGWIRVEGDGGTVLGLGRVVEVTSTFTLQNINMLMYR